MSFLNYFVFLIIPICDVYLSIFLVIFCTRPLSMIRYCHGSPCSAVMCVRQACCPLSGCRVCGLGLFRTGCFCTGVIQPPFSK